MQCFGGCFAADKDLKEHPVGAARNGSDTDGIPDSASGRATLKAKLRLLSSKSSKSSQLQDVPDVAHTTKSESSAADREQLRQEYLMQHGRHILGISTLQQEQLRHFVVPGIGYIAFAWMVNGLEMMNKKTAVALSDPVCDRQHFRTMAVAFIKEHPQAMFVQASFEFASILQTLDFTCNSMGGETRLDLATYNFTGYARRGLRSAITSAVKDGIKVEEVMHPSADSLGTAAANGAGAAATAAAGTDWAQLAQELKDVDAKWAASKNGRANDVWFINRPPVFAPEAGVRKFIARNAAGDIQGFIFFDGVFENGQLTGYYANVTRMLPDAHPGCLNLMMKEFIEKVRAETQLAAPAKKLSMRKSQRKKLEAAAAAAGGAATDSADATPANAKDQDQPAPAPAGPKFLSLGLSPFYQMNNKPIPEWKSCKLTYLLLLLCYEDGAGFYPFKTLAAAKAKYGAGLHDFKYEDPNVEYRNAFLCHNRKGVNAAFWGMFDLAKLYGFWTDPMDCFGRYFSYKGQQGALLMAKGLKKAASLDTYKPKKKKKAKKAKSFSGSDSKSSSSRTADAELLRSASAPAAVSGGGGKKGKTGAEAAGAAQKQQKQGKKAAVAGAAAAAAAAGGAAAGVSRLTPAASDASLIATASNPPGPESTVASGSDGSDAASFASAVTSHSDGSVQGSPGKARMSSSDSDA